MEHLWEKLDLLHAENGVVRVPFLVKGRIQAPERVAKARIEAAFAAEGPDTHYVRLPEAQVLRQPVIDRATMRPTGECVYQVLPLVDPAALVEDDFDGLARGLYALRVDEILAYLECIAGALEANASLGGQVLELARRTADFPDLYLDGSFAAFESGLDTQAARAMIDNELGAWGMPGSRLLDGWVDVPGDPIPGLARWAGASMLGWELTPAGDGAHEAVCSGSPPPGGAGDRMRLRALPTRQLHITAGNSPEIPVISALRAILTKSAAVIKSPHEATLTGALLGLLMAEAAPSHPLTRHLSVVYWPGGDERVENRLFRPGAFDRIIVWGAPDAVASVQSRALFTRVICFNPRYGASLIGREAFADLAYVARAATVDAMIYNQKACTAPLVQYVEGSEDEAAAYAEALRAALSEWDSRVPQYVPAATRGQLKRMRRGRYSRASWHVNEAAGEFTSGVVVTGEEFDILDHPMCRLVVVRPVPDLANALGYLHHGVSTVGVYPEARRLALADAILARGVSNVLPLGQCERVAAGAPHDGMLVLNQLVDWKNS